MIFLQVSLYTQKLTIEIAPKLSHEKGHGRNSEKRGRKWGTHDASWEIDIGCHAGQRPAWHPKNKSHTSQSTLFCHHFSSDAQYSSYALRTLAEHREHVDSSSSPRYRTYTVHTRNHPLISGPTGKIDHVGPFQRILTNPFAYTAI